MAKKYVVKLRSGLSETIEADNVHVTAQGNIKLLNGKGINATLVAFFNAGDVVSVIVQPEV